MIILFDGVCNLCNRFVDFIIRRDLAGTFQFAALQSDHGRELLQARGIDAEHLRSVVLINDDGTFQKSEAVIRILRELPGWGWFGVFRLVPTALRNIVYGTIAASRYRLMGKKETCRIPTLEERGRFLE